MNVCVLSMFSSSMGYVGRYFDQVEGLRHLLIRDGNKLSLVLAEGDHRDDTAAELRRQVETRWLAATVIEASHGGEVYGSVVDAKRFAQLAGIGNALLERVHGDDDVAVFVESDLIWEPETLTMLIEQVGPYDIVAPNVLLGSLWYDVWGFAAGGERFHHETPYHPALESG